MGCGIQDQEVLIAPQWEEVELAFSSEMEYENPYTDVEFWDEFTGPEGEKLVRPGYWEQGTTWKVRFANPISSGKWTWESFLPIPPIQGLIDGQVTYNANRIQERIYKVLDKETIHARC